MKRNGATVAGVFVLALFTLVGVAWARGHRGSADEKPVRSPHGTYASDTTYCDSCHVSHDGTGANLSSMQTEKAACLKCHSGQDGAPNVQGEYKRSQGGLSPDSMGHRVLPDPADGSLSCTDCHSPHQDPADNPGLLRVQVLNPKNGHKVFLYNAKDAPVGNEYCYACHGPKDSIAGDPLPAPFGDFTGFEESAHGQTWQMDQASNPDDQPLPADRTRWSDKQRVAEREDNMTGKITCQYCHAPHDSDNNGITTADEEALCFQCHSKANPNTADDTSPYRAFNATPNVYGDGESAVRIYHHPIAEAEQQEGARKVECISCHNPHFDDTTDTARQSVVTNPLRALVSWPPKPKASAKLRASANRQQHHEPGPPQVRQDRQKRARPEPRVRTDAETNTFCMTCHVAPDVTTPIEAGDKVPYNVRMVNDRSLDPGGQPHDLFTASQYPQSLHATVACADCHDVHGSSNAYALREIGATPDGSQQRVFGFNGMDQPDDRKLYAEFCLGCHSDTAGPHVDRMLEQGTYCRECHYHGGDQF